MIKYKQLFHLPHIYQNDYDTIISPFNIEYTQEWYNKECGSDDELHELILFKPYSQFELPLEPVYQQEDSKVIFWDNATKEEIEKLGTNYMIQPNVSRLGTIKNFYGDIYTLRSFYEVLPKYAEIKEPELLCSSEF